MVTGSAGCLDLCSASILPPGRTFRPSLHKPSRQDGRSAPILFSPFWLGYDGGPERRSLAIPTPLALSRCCSQPKTFLWTACLYVARIYIMVAFIQRPVPSLPAGGHGNGWSSIGQAKRVVCFRGGPKYPSLAAPLPVLARTRTIPTAMLPQVGESKGDANLEDGIAKLRLSRCDRRRRHPPRR